MRPIVIAALLLVLASATVGCGLAKDIAHGWAANLGEWYPDCDELTQKTMAACVSSTHDSAKCIDQAQMENWGCNYTAETKRKFKTCTYQVPASVFG